MSRLVLRGIPLNKVHLFKLADSTDIGYIATQRVFSELRGDGTPLLPKPESTIDVGPAPYLRKVVKSILVKYITQDKPLLLTDEEVKVGAEAHLALIETTAKGIMSTKEAPTEVALSSDYIVSNFGATLLNRDEWLDLSIVKSLVRSVEASDNEKAAAVKSEYTDPVLRLSTESAYWRDIPPHGIKEKSGALVGASLLNDAKASDKIVFDTTQLIPKADTKLSTSGDDWENVSKQLLVNAVSNITSGTAVTLDAERLRRDILFKVFNTTTEDSVAYNGFVINPSNVREYLSSKLDVMRTYEYQPV
jgi:hypothetical protein